MVTFGNTCFWQLRLGIFNFLSRGHWDSSICSLTSKLKFWLINRKTYEKYETSSIKAVKIHTRKWIHWKISFMLLHYSPAKTWLFKHSTPHITDAAHQLQLKYYVTKKWGHGSQWFNIERISKNIAGAVYDLPVNPIPTGHGRNQPIYERHVTKSGRNRVK